MKVVGLITEYNPFHNGHKYHIEQARLLTAADYVVVVMSGDFVQRGEPALLDKYSRAAMALSEGADLVLELPVQYATGSAEYFATGAVSLLDSLGIVDTLCFGSECGNLEILDTLAKILLEEPAPYQQALKDALKSGMSYPSARANALKQYLSDKQNINSEELTEVLSKPNNILGIEYLKALRRLDSQIHPYTITRVGNHYNEKNLTGQISSATAIRTLLEQFQNTAKTQDIFNSQISDSVPDKQENLPSDNIFAELKTQIPEHAWQIMKDAYLKTFPIFSKDASALLHYRLLQVRSSEELTQSLDLTADLADRIYKLRAQYTDFDSFVALIKTKQLTETRIRRGLLHLLLGIKTVEVDKPEQGCSHRYIRPLGFRSSATSLLSEIKKRSSLPIISKLADASSILDSDGLEILNKNLFASEVYHSMVTAKYAAEPYNEYTKPMLIY